jgi:hypothetical protein
MYRVVSATETVAQAACQTSRVADAGWRGKCKSVIFQEIATFLAISCGKET